MKKKNGIMIAPSHFIEKIFFKLIFFWNNFYAEGAAANSDFS